jgi:hypothetical protein
MATAPRPARRRRFPPRRWGASRCCRRKQLHRLLHPHLRQIHARPTAEGGGRQGAEKLTAAEARTRSGALWRKYFNVNRVETATRKFNDRIASDGVGVTVVMAATQALVQSNTNDDPSVLPRRPTVLYGGNDPGITDVATVTHMDASGSPRRPVQLVAILRARRSWSRAAGREVERRCSRSSTP